MGQLIAQGHRVSKWHSRNFRTKQTKAVAHLVPRGGSDLNADQMVSGAPIPAPPYSPSPLPASHTPHPSSGCSEPPNSGLLSLTRPLRLFSSERRLPPPTPSETGTRNWESASGAGVPLSQARVGWGAVPAVTHGWALSLWKHSSWQGGHGGQWSCAGPGPCLSYRQKRGRSVGLPEACTRCGLPGPRPPQPPPQML